MPCNFDAHAAAAQVAPKETATIAAIAAKFALAVWEFRRVDDGYLVARWSAHRVLPDLAAVYAFARQVGVDGA